MTNHGSDNWDVCFSDDGKTCYTFEWYSNVRGMIMNEVFAPDVKNFITIAIEEKINDNNIIWTINYEHFENPEHPESHKMFLVRSPKETIKDAQWAFRGSNNESLFYVHDMKWHKYISRCKKWLWCYEDDIEPIIV